MSTPAGHAPVRAEHVASLGLLALIWGASYLQIKFAVEDLSPPVVVALRTLVATACLAVYLAIRSRRELREVLSDARRRPGSAALLAATAVGGPFLLITMGEIWVPSGIAAVLVASVPIFLGFLAPTYDRSEIPGRVQWVGLVLGICGVGVLVGVETVHSVAEFAGAMAVLGAALLYALSAVVVRLRYAGFSPVGLSLLEVGASAVVLVPVSLLFLPDAPPGARAVTSVILLGAIGTALAFVVFYGVFNAIGAARSSLVAYLIPPVSLLLGALILDERLRPGGIVGTTMILAGTALAARRPAAP